MSNKFLRAAVSYHGFIEETVREAALFSDGGDLALSLELKLNSDDLAGIAIHVKALDLEEPQVPESSQAPIVVANEQRLRDEYNAMDKRSRSEFGAFHRYKAWRLGHETGVTEKVEVPPYVYLSPAEATPQQKAMAIGRDEKGNYAIAVEDLTDKQKAAHIEQRTAEELRALQEEMDVHLADGAGESLNPGTAADNMRAEYVQRTMDAHARLNGAGEPEPSPAGWRDAVRRGEGLPPLSSVLTGADGKPTSNADDFGGLPG